MPASRYVLKSPNDLQSLQKWEWQKVAGRRSSAPDEKSIRLDWRAQGGEEFRQEVTSYEKTWDSLLDFHWSGREADFREEFGDLVRGADVPRALNADAAKVFCANVGRSRTPQLEDCQLWAFVGRYGATVVYAELFGVRESWEMFRDVVVELDHFVARERASSLSHSAQRSSDDA